ncbi:MAG: hypothetical protein ACYC7D_14350 [Nitrososphaerales archaeon]
MKSKAGLIAISLLALLFLSANLGLTASAYSGNQIHSTVSYNFVKGSDPASSYFILTVSATVNNGDAFAKHQLQVQSWGKVNGTGFATATCSLRFSEDQLTDSCSFTMPFAGSGNYGFYALVSANHKILSFSVIDPLIEPEW